MFCFVLALRNINPKPIASALGAKHLENLLWAQVCRYLHVLDSALNGLLGHLFKGQIDSSEAKALLAASFPSKTVAHHYIMQAEAVRRHFKTSGAPKCHICPGAALQKCSTRKPSGAGAEPTLHSAGALHRDPAQHLPALRHNTASQWKAAREMGLGLTSHLRSGNYAQVKVYHCWLHRMKSGEYFESCCRHSILRWLEWLL